MRRLYSDSYSERIIRDTGENIDKDEDTREEDKEKLKKKQKRQSGRGRKEREERQGVNQRGRKRWGESN